MAYEMEPQSDNTLTEEEQEYILRMNALSRVYEQTDRVLTGDPVKIVVVDNGPAPSWSDGQTIWFNASRIDEIDLETLTQISGLNYHELAHHLYSPRRGTDMVKWVMTEGLVHSMNLLEDQRIDTLLVGKYSATAPFLSASALRWLAESPEDVQVNYMAIRGRRYLPVEVRELFRDEFMMPELIPVIADIVDKYRILAFPRDYEVAKDLIKRFQDEVLVHFPKPPEGPNSCTDRSPTQKGRPEPGKAQEQDAEYGEGMGDEESEYAPQPLTGDPNTNNQGQQGEHDCRLGECDGKHGQGQQGQGQGQQGQGQGQGQQGQGQGQQGQGQGQANGGTVPPKDEPADGSIKKLTFGSGHVASKGAVNVPADIRRSIQSSIATINNRRDVIQDGRAKQKLITGGDGKNSELIKRGKYTDTDLPLEIISSYRRFSRELQRLREACEPGWERETATGRLNVQRVIKGVELDRVFDRWDEGNDGADMEAIILIDRSGSMSSGRNDMVASQACWTIKRAMEDVEAPVTVYAFDDKPELAYSSTEKVNRTSFKFIYGSGGTDPYSSLLAAERLLKTSKKKNKVLFLITDGCFNGEQVDPVIARINKSGVTTATVLIMDDSSFKQYAAYSADYTSRYGVGGYNPYQVDHGTEVTTRINHARELLPFAKAVVTAAIQKKMRNY
jgi:hypothetical protein